MSIGSLTTSYVSLQSLESLLPHSLFDAFLQFCLISHFFWVMTSAMKLSRMWQPGKEYQRDGFGRVIKHLINFRNGGICSPSCLCAIWSNMKTTYAKKIAGGEGIEKWHRCQIIWTYYFWTKVKPKKGAYMPFLTHCISHGKPRIWRVDMF